MLITQTQNIDSIFKSLRYDSLHFTVRLEFIPAKMSDKKLLLIEPITEEETTLLLIFPVETLKHQSCHYKELSGKIHKGNKYPIRNEI